MKRKEHGYITNRLLYQLSYVGLSSILNGGWKTVKQDADGALRHSRIREREANGF